jgi:hypothetical protein
LLLAFGFLGLASGVAVGVGVTVGAGVLVGVGAADTVGAGLGNGVASGFNFVRLEGIGTNAEPSLSNLPRANRL